MLRRLSCAGCLYARRRGTLDKWALFRHKDRLSRNRYSHYKDMTVARPSYLYNGKHIGETSLYLCIITYLIIQYIPRNMHTVFALLCFVVVIHWLIFPYPSGSLHWHCGNLTISPVPAKQPWWIWINTSCEFIMNDCITTTKQSTTKRCAYLLGYT